MSDERLPTNEQPHERGSMLRGFLVAAASNAIALAVTILVIIGAARTGFLLPLFVLMGFGLIQFLWLVPLWQSYKTQGATETAKGVLIAMGITVLLSAGCWGAFTYSYGELNQPYPQIAPRSLGPK